MDEPNDYVITINPTPETKDNTVVPISTPVEKNTVTVVSESQPSSPVYIVSE